MLDYDRFETGQLVPRETRFRLGEAAAEPIETLRRLRDDRRSATSRWRARPPTASGTLYGDRELVASRDPEPGDGGAAPVGRAHSELAIEIAETDAGMRFRVAVAGRAAAAERARQHLRAVRPARRRHRRCTAWAWRWRARIVELHEGTLWVEDLPTGGCAFVFELRLEAQPARGRARSPSTPRSQGRVEPPEQP